MKKPIATATLLCLIQSTSSFSSSSSFPDGASNNRIPSPTPQSSPVKTSTNPTSERRTGGDLFTEVVIRKKPKPKRRQPRTSPAAPVVDSALLRFLSTQRKSASIVEAINTNNSSSASRNSATTSTTLESSPTWTSSTTATTTTTTDSSTSYWLGQYNANRVAQLLMDHCGLQDESSANAAGQMVQSHVLVRTTRRRVRAFLRKRDQQWVNTMRMIDSGSSADQNNNKNVVNGDNYNNNFINAAASSSPLDVKEEAAPWYGLKDVVDLLMESGLTGTDIAAILTHTPGVAMMMPYRLESRTDAVNSSSTSSVVSSSTKAISNGETLQEALERGFDGVLLNTLKLRRYDARKVLRTCPGLLTSKGSKRAMDVVTVMRSMGVSASALAREKSELPILLSRAPSALFRLVAFLASDAVRMSVQNIGPLLRRKESLEILNIVAPPVVPGLLPPSPSSSSATSITTTASENENDGTATTIMDQINNVARLGEKRRYETNEVYKNMSKTAWTLRNEIGTEDLGKVVAAYPSVLLLDVEKQILPTASYLMTLLDDLEDDLPRVLQLYPVLLGQNRQKMEEIVTYLKDLGVEEESLPSMFRAFPALLTMNIEVSMKPVVKFLQEIGIVNVGRFITRLPPVLGYSVEEELRPKWEYLSKVCLYPSFELSTFPAYFSYPLDRVIKTRYEYLQFVKKSSTNLLALDLVLRYGDKDFAEKVAKDEDRGRAFGEFAKLRKAVRTEQARRKKSPRKKSKRQQKQPKQSPPRS